MQKEPNKLMLIFSLIGFTAVVCYIGHLISKKIDEHNYKKLKAEESKWFYK